MHYPDLGRQAQIAEGSWVRAVGWLSSTRQYSKGSVSREDLAKIKQLCAAWGKATEALGWPVACGLHTCEFCGSFRSSGNVGIPAGDILFVAPEMLAHYIEHHEYAPPEEFMKAAALAPVPGTREYAIAVHRFVKAQTDAG